MTYKIPLTAIILLALAGCAGPGSDWAGKRLLPSEKFVGMPHGCGIWDTWKDRDPRVTPLGRGAPNTSTVGSTGSICDEEVYRLRFNKEWESPARIEMMPLEE